MTRAYFDVPSDIVECATKLRAYFDERNIKDWAIDGVCRVPEGPRIYLRRIVYEWTKDDAREARKEGWRLAERNDGFLEIQKEDDSTAFESDVSAQAFVRKHARDWPMYKRAWALHATRWYEVCR